MQVTVKLFASFRLKWGREIVAEYPGGASLADIRGAIGIPPLCITLLNGRHALPGDMVQDGDVVSFMPLIGGG